LHNIERLQTEHQGKITIFEQQRIKLAKYEARVQNIEARFKKKQQSHNSLRSCEGISLNRK
jgi:hypothetical protein